MRPASKGLLYGILAVIFWGTAATAFKISLRYLHPAELLAIAAYTTILILVSILIFQKRFSDVFRQSRKVIFQAAFLGLLNPFLYYLILFRAYSMIPAQIAQPLNFIWPIVLVLLSVPILNHPITRYNVLALIISFSGVLLISAQGNMSFTALDHPQGIFLAAGSSVIWALYWIFNMKQRIDEVLGLFLNFLFSAIYISIFLAFTGGFHIPPAQGFLGGVYVGCFEMGITFVLWLKALNYSGSAAKVGNLIYLTPFLSLICIHFILGEEIYLTTFGGLVLIIIGLFVNKHN
jgi:drug/metabolite transporter (DMT)-like permease